MTTKNKAITRIQVDGYRSLKAVDLTLGRGTVLIGANGSGKSNLLSLVRLVPLLRTQSLRRFVGVAGGASALLHYGPEVTKQIDLRLEFEQDEGAYAYAATLGYATRDTLVYLDEIVSHRPTGAAGWSSVSLGSGHSESRLDDEARKPENDAARVVLQWLSRMSFFHFHDTSLTSPLRQNARQSDDQVLRSDGSNLAAFLRRLSISSAPDDQAAWRRIGGLVHRIAPYVKRLDPALVDAAHPETSAVRLYWFDERDYRFDVHDFSDGTLRTIALIAALTQPVSSLPAFVSIDEPELGLHPAMITLFAALVRSASPHCQVLLATQSSSLLDEFEADEVVVTERQNGETSFRRLSAGELAGWLEDYTLSELYDKNILGGRP